MKTKVRKSKEKKDKDSDLIQKIYKTYRESWNKLDLVRKKGYEEVMESG